MTHLVIDSTVLDALIAAGDAVNHAADNRLCECRYNVPYDSGKVPRFVVEQCFRCRAQEQWRNAKATIAKACAGDGAKATA